MFFFGNNYYLETKKKLYLICNILKLRPIRTQNFLNNLERSRDIRRKKNLKILKIRFFEKISRFKKYKNVKFAVFEIA